MLTRHSSNSVGCNTDKSGGNHAAHKEAKSLSRKDEALILQRLLICIDLSKLLQRNSGRLIRGRQAASL